LPLLEHMDGIFVHRVIISNQELPSRILLPSTTVIDLGDLFHLVMIPIGKTIIKPTGP